MELRQLRYFLAIVDAGSFTQAAEELHMSQPPLSLAVKNLERDLGVTLLVRTPKGVRTTEAGRHLEQTGRRLLHGFDDLTQSLRDLGEGRAGRLRVAAVPSFSWAHLAPLVTEYAERAPDVEIALADPAPAQVLRAVREGTADVGIVACADPATLARNLRGELNAVPARELPLVVALPPRLAAMSAPNQPIDLRALEDERWMIPGEVAGFPGLPELIETIWLRLGIRPAKLREVSTLQTAVPLIAAGAGVALVPDTIGRIAQDSVALRPIAQAVPPLVATVLWSAEGVLTPAARRFVELATRGAGA
ncbi:LysR family transcriptional regulator [Tomitella gaofuii]|uniref:LysR family transcriptional regulator n=1 Tax=Tomitella gaofuii TaxID=2760083 RepID=UPI0015F8AA2C|nr:LysR family transcriptional regulator [Tomitella gaofuii]